MTKTVVKLTQIIQEEERLHLHLEHQESKSNKGEYQIQNHSQ